ncbi:MAG: signal recognition particle-docking protein FtsY [Desulfovibrio sp.]|nr:signal recognition particle-docking protein FtsY [Desulfovibrio sp.]
MGFFSRLKKIFGSQPDEETKQREELLVTSSAAETKAPAFEPQKDSQTGSEAFTAQEPAEVPTPLSSPANKEDEKGSLDEALTKDQSEPASEKAQAAESTSFAAQREEAAAEASPSKESTSEEDEKGSPREALSKDLPEPASEKVQAAESTSFAAQSEEPAAEASPSKESTSEEDEKGSLGETLTKDQSEPASEKKRESSGWFSFFGWGRSQSSEESAQASTSEKAQSEALESASDLNVQAAEQESTSETVFPEQTEAVSPKTSLQASDTQKAQVDQDSAREDRAAKPEPLPSQDQAPAAEAQATGLDNDTLPVETASKADLAEASSEQVLQTARNPEEAKLVVRLREAEPKLSAWLAIVLDGVEEAGDLLFDRLRFLLRSLEAPEDEIESFVGDFAAWLEDMEYTYLDEFRSELQYRLALALELEDEEDERNRLFLKIHDGLAKTREQLQRKLNSLLSSHGSLDESFYEHLEEIFITADLGYEASLELVSRLRQRAQSQGITDASQIGILLRQELEEIFHIPPHITAYTAPEVVLMVGVNGVGKTTTIGKLAHRARLRGRKVMICAADTFRAAAIEQLKVWAERAGALFHAKQQGADPASVAYEALDQAMQQGVDLLFIDTAGRLQTKTNLMEELSKIRNVIGKKHPGSPHRTVLVIDATTGQNALSQVKLFREASGVDELILTKLDGTAKGGFAIALALQYHLPFSFIGLGEKLEDLRPFSGKDFADALIGSLGKATESEENS